MLAESLGLGLPAPGAGALDRCEFEQLLSHPAWLGKYSEFMPVVWAKMRELGIPDGVYDAVPWLRSLPGVAAVKYVRRECPAPGWCVKFEDGTSVIWLAASIRGKPQEQFVTCHEAAHHLFHPPGRYVFGARDPGAARIHEIQANWAASELKMPSWRFNRFAAVFGFDADRLARRFNVSFTAAQNRVEALIRRLRRKGALPNRCPQCGRQLLPTELGCPRCRVLSTLARAVFPPPEPGYEDLEGPPRA